MLNFLSRFNQNEFRKYNLHTGGQTTDARRTWFHTSSETGRENTSALLKD